MLFPRTCFTANTVRPLIARTTCQSVARPPTTTPVRHLRTATNGNAGIGTSVLAPALNRIRGGVLPQSTGGASMLSNDSRSHLHTATADAFYPSNTQVFGEFFRANSTSPYLGGTSPPVPSYASSTSYAESELAWDDFTLYDDDSPAGEFSWDVTGATPALFAPLGEVFASALSNTNERKAEDSEMEQENDFISTEHPHSYERQ
ncbi:hypothetical protein K493DRAFT_316677 [Basidiobolus meristosporus CBS 931.73]|uniref:Uncharacterized protein n=1 Tax=Basidiobolus meristosporus CBS 931.73 TaxID=1314790 RepID=A0A1Y1Y2S2_9FUNG|nr:hypothetical protein K493DRAFT_316677 [Basidiobolus meristosporus CBS 931.73]|eukprot:ORX92279.1 hypothetical protein K493DRAFT_316677 [Basidiobolus meristosporus CBS 931.73]